MNDYGEMFYGTLPPDTQDFRQVLAGIGRAIRERATTAGQRIVESAREARALQDQAFGDPTRPTRVTDEAALRRLTDMIMAGPLGFAPAGITAFHGSPYLFRQFDPMKVGTGEGAQAYGVGAGYTAEARPVAEEYMRQVTAGTPQPPVRTFRGEELIPQTPEYMAARLLDSDKMSLPQARKEVSSWIASAKPEMQREVTNWQKTLDILNQAEKKSDFKNLGDRSYLYKGDIPDEILPKFLDWDKPLSQQSDEVRNVLKRRITDVQPTDKFDMGGNAQLRDNRQGQYDKTSPNPWILESYDANGTRAFGLSQKDVDRMFGAKDVKDLTGEQIYARLTQQMGSQQAASEYLNSIGVRGIRYLDQGSRGEGKGTSNFIPFRAEDYKIQEINDIPIEQYFQRGLLDRPMSPKEQAKAAWEANPDNKELYEAYRKLRLSE